MNMILNATERKLAVCLGKLHEEPREDGVLICSDRLQKMAEIPSDKKFNQALTVLSNKGLLTLNFDASAFSPEPLALDVAREIEAQEQEAAKPQDRVRNLMAKARSHRVIAPFVFVAELLGPPVGLIGGILGIVAIVIMIVQGC